MSVSRHQYPYSHGLQRAANDGGDPLRSEVLLYPRTFYTDVNRLWLLSIFGEVESAGTSEREMESFSLRHDAVFPPVLWIEKRRKTPKPPRFTKYDTVGEVIFALASGLIR